MVLVIPEQDTIISSHLNIKLLVGSKGNVSFSLEITVGLEKSYGIFNSHPRYNLKVIQESVSREISKVITSYEYISVDHSLHSTVPHVPESRRLRVLVTGGAGFVGSHLVDRYSSHNFHSHGGIGVCRNI